MNEASKNHKALREEQLGMSVGKARNILNKSIMFMLVQKSNMDTCFQCGHKIESVDELTVEHMTPWLHEENAIELYFDLDNIAFSHAFCNSSAARRGNRDYPRRELLNPTRYTGRRIGQSGFKGVGLAKKGESYKYMAKIRHNNRYIHLGCGNDAKELAELYDKKALELHGDKAVTNRMLGLLNTDSNIINEADIYEGAMFKGLDTYKVLSSLDDTTKFILIDVNDNRGTNEKTKTELAKLLNSISAQKLL